MAEKLQAHARSIERYYAETNMNSLTQAIPVSAVTQIALAAAPVNTGSCFSTSTKRFTPPIGKYTVNYGFLLSTNMADGDEVSIGLRKNGTEVRRVTQSAAQAGFCAVDGTISFEQTVATDYWDLAITVDGSGSDRTLGSVSFSSLNNWAIWRQE